MFSKGIFLLELDSFHLQVVHFPGVFVVEALALELETGGIIIATAEGNNVMTDGREGAQLMTRWGIGITIPSREGGGVTRSEKSSKVVGDPAADPGQLGRMPGGRLYLLEQFTLVPPFTKTALTPMGKVGFVDRTATKVSGENSADITVAV